METTIRIRSKTLRITTEGVVLSDGQVLHALRHAGIIPQDDRGEWSIGVGVGKAWLCYKARTPSGKISKVIEDYGAISIDGYAYQGHSYSNPAIKFGHASWSFVKV